MAFAIANALLLLAAMGVLAAPVDDVDNSVNAVSPPAAVTAISNSQVDSYTPFTHYAAAGYCNPSVTKTWTCGTNCDANPGFKPIASGGDGSSTQFWYVGYDKTLQTIVVVHQGTNKFAILSLLTDADFYLTSLDSTVFPGVPSSVEVHNGFKEEHERTANAVLAAVSSGVNTYGTKSVTTVGHSLGAALSLLDAVFLLLQIPGLTVTHYGYGLPRVGNQDFANYVDSRLSGRFTRITNLKDPIPILPGLFLGFKHPSGEAHINDGEIWKWCSGQDNPDTQCSVGNTPNIFKSDLNDHDGPYNGITLGC